MTAAQNSTCGMRPRKNNRHLPARMYEKHGAFHYVDSDNKWHRLGPTSDYGKALEAYARHVSAGGNSVAALVDNYFLDPDFLALAESTKKEYRRLGEIIKKIFAEFTDATTVEPKHIAQAIDDEAKTAPVQSRRMRSLLLSVFALAVRKGKVTANPVRDIKARKYKKKTKRYVTDKEFAAVKAKVPPTMACIMDFCYVTAQRISDVLKVTIGDIRPEGVYFQQKKTGNELIVKMTPDLAEIIERAKALNRAHRKARVVPINDANRPLFRSRQGGKAFSYFGVSTMFRRGRDAVGAKWTIHDIRHKALTDAKNLGLNPTELAGHKDERTTTIYIHQREVPIVTPPSMPKTA